MSSGMPLLSSQQSEIYDLNQNQRSDSSQSSSPNSQTQNTLIPTEDQSSPNNITDINSSMGNCLNHTTSADISVNLPSEVTEIKVHGQTPYKLSADDLTLPTQDLIKKILCQKEYLSDIGPAGLQLFGIASIDPKRSCKCIWKNPQKPLHDGDSRSSLNSCLYLRIRFIPSKSRIEKIKTLGKAVIAYLYHQCKEDLIVDRLSSLYRKEISSAKARGLAVLDVAITSRLQNKPADEILKQDLKQFLPPKERVKFWRRYKLIDNMKPHVMKFMEKSLETEDLMIGYVIDILQEFMEYTIEQYEANYKKNWNDDETKVRVLIDVHHEPSGVHIDKEHFACIEHISSMSLKPSYDENSTWTVHMNRSTGHMKEIMFPNEEIATSFVSGVEGYYRLTYDYYFSVCQQVEPPSLRELKLLKCFGPIEDRVAIQKLQKLRRQDTTEDFYILTQSLQNFDEYCLFYTNNNDKQTRRKVLTLKPGNKFCIKDQEDKIFDNFPDLLRHLTRGTQFLPGQMAKIPRRVGRPNTAEPCNILRQVFTEESDLILDEDAERETSGSGQRQKKVPRIFLPTEVHINDLLSVGTFTEVHTAVLSNECGVAVKVLRPARQEQLFRCLEPFQNCVNKQLNFTDPHFLTIQGVCLSSPPKIIMDHVPLGSLATFFVRRRPEQVLYLYHLMFAATQVAEGLLYIAEKQAELGEICHGNICCRNILVHRYEDSTIVVKIGDPGMVELYNQLPLTHKVNLRRLPWIAPERFDNLSAMDIRTDIYAFGTTMWEIFAQGCNPLDYKPLKDKSDQEVCN